MNANAPFDKAVKHLFRHLHDPRALIRNPLLRDIFDNATLRKVGRDRDRLILTQIHGLVRKAAIYYRDVDFRTGKRRRGLHQFEIITRECLEQQPIADVAKDLGISTQHCYRERAAICRRIGHFICEGVDGPSLEQLSELDEFRSRADRAAREVANGDSVASFHEYDLLIKTATSVEEKVEAQCRKADAALSFGRVKLADASFSAAKKQAVYAGAQISASSSVARAWLDLTGAKFAYFRGDAPQSIRLMRRAALALEALQVDGSVSIRELYAESLSDVGAGLWNIGDRYPAFDYMIKAEEVARTLPARSSQTRSHVAIQFWKFRSQLLMSPTHWCPVSERITALTEVFEGAYASGWLFQAIEALGVIVTSAALAGRKTEATRAAKVALALASQQGNERVKTLVPVTLAAHLMSTDCWEEGLAIFSTVKRLEECERYLHASVSYIVAARALRHRQFNDAWRLAKDSIQRGEPIDVTLRKQVVAATAALELGRQPLARQILEDVIPKAEALGSVPLLRDACHAAAKLPGGDRRRLQRRARNLSELLAM
jgi:hypothetical protein